MQDMAHGFNFIVFFKTPKALNTDWNNPSIFFLIKAVVWEITTSELQKKIFAFNDF